MKLNNDLIIICATVLMSIHMIMKGLFNIVTVRNAGEVMSNNFMEVLANMEELKKGTK